MKKTLIMVASATALFATSVSAGYSDSSYNWNSASKSAPTKSSTSAKTTRNTLIAHSYGRMNTASTADIHTSASMSGSSYKSTLAMVKAEQGKAKKVGFEWNTIRKLMKKAKKDHKGGNDSAAIKKLKTAITHAKLGQKQAMDQRGAGPRF